MRARERVRDHSRSGRDRSEHRVRTHGANASQVEDVRREQTLANARERSQRTPPSERRANAGDTKIVRDMLEDVLVQLLIILVYPTAAGSMSVYMQWMIGVPAAFSPALIFFCSLVLPAEKLLPRPWCHLVKFTKRCMRRSGKPSQGTGEVHPVWFISLALFLPAYLHYRAGRVLLELQKARFFRCSPSSFHFDCEDLRSTVRTPPVHVFPSLAAVPLFGVIVHLLGLAALRSRPSKESSIFQLGSTLGVGLFLSDMFYPCSLDQFTSPITPEPFLPWIAGRVSSAWRSQCFVLYFAVTLVSRATSPGYKVVGLALACAWLFGDHRACCLALPLLAAFAVFQWLGLIGRVHVVHEVRSAACELLAYCRGKPTGLSLPCHEDVRDLQREVACLKRRLELAQAQVAAARGGEFRLMAPRDIRFTHSSISMCFRNGNAIDATIRRIMSKDMSVDELPQIEVTFYGDQCYSLNNRRLFVFRVLASKRLVGLIPVTVQAFESYRVQAKRDGKTKWERAFSTHNGGHAVHAARRCGVCSESHRSEFENMQM